MFLCLEKVFKFYSLISTYIYVAVNFYSWISTLYLCGWRKSLNTQFALLSHIEKWVKTLDSKGAYIKYVGGETGGFYKYFKKIFVPLDTINLNISSPSNFFRKYFMTPAINFSFLFKAYLQQYFRVVLSNIQISNHQRSWHSQ